MTTKNEWRESMLCLLDRLGAESRPYVDSTPSEAQNAIYDHVNWLEEYTTGTALHNVIMYIFDRFPDVKRSIMRGNS